jgi:hypothetical protein
MTDLSKPIVFISGPFRGPHHFAIHENICRAERLSLEVWKAGGVGLCPHLNTAHFQGVLLDRVWLTGDLKLLYVSDAILMTPDWQDSDGAIVERQRAIEWKKRVMYAEHWDRLPPEVEQWIRKGVEWKT